MSDGLYGPGYNGGSFDFSTNYEAVYSTSFVTTVSEITVTAAPGTTNAWDFSTVQGQDNWIQSALFIGGAAVTIVGSIMAGIAGLAGFGAALAAIGILIVVVGGVWWVVHALAH